MAKVVDSLPDDVETLKALVIAERVRAANAEAQAHALALHVEKMKFEIARLRHETYGQSAERSALLEQLELHLADLEETASQSEATAQIAAAAAAREKIAVIAFERRKPARRPLPEHLPRERVVYPGLTVCPCCGGVALRKIGEDVTEMLEAIPRQWKVIQHVREKFSCRACETISQPPAPSHPIARGRAGPALLAQILFSKYGLHLPLNRQSAVYEREGINLDVSTLADWVGAASATLMPLVDCIEGHVFAGERIHADDTPVPVLAKGKTRTGRLYTYVGNDPLDETDPTGEDAWMVGRRVYEVILGVKVPIGNHVFVVVAPKYGATPTAQFDYGPSNGKLVELHGDPTNFTTMTDTNAYKGNDPTASVSRINAPDSAVIAAGKKMDQELGTPNKPGRVTYNALPTGPNEGNSNSAASDVVDQAQKSQNPASPVPGEPASVFPAPGWLHPYSPAPTANKQGGGVGDVRSCTGNMGDCNK